MKIAAIPSPQNLLHHSCFFTLASRKTAYDGSHYNQFWDLDIDIFWIDLCNPYRLPTETALANQLVEKPICRTY
ncbi:hypothetical protein G5B35_04770 [Parapusillimonas sp. SGNA-6]|nr:hypothetical protein [Parapusillimonas sp. SGNA-6]